MKNPGFIVSYTDDKGNIQYGNTYNKDGKYNGKVIVYPTDEVGIEITNAKPLLVDYKKLSIIGIID